MNCKSVQSRLSAYLDREMNGDELLQVRRHLSNCPDCREEEESLRTLRRLLAEAPIPEPPADLADRLTARVLAERVEVRRRSQFKLGFATFAGVAACSMLGTFLLIGSLRSTSDADPSIAAKQEAAQEDLRFEVQRDQAYAAGFDAIGGAPVFSAVNHGPR